MKKVVKRSSILLKIFLSLAIIFIGIPLLLSLFSDSPINGNVALIPIEGAIMGSQGSSFGTPIVSSQSIIEFIEKAEENNNIEAIVLEVNSPGGSAVASDEIAVALKKSKKPKVTLIREVGASGGYWIATATDHIVANRMSITGSIGVISSYLEFSGLMEQYGISNERLVAGDRKDIGTPTKKLSKEEKALMQKKLDLIHNFFINEVVENRNLPKTKVEELATGEFFLGVEALNHGLIDELGDKETVTKYLKNQGIEDVEYSTYEKQPGFFESLTGVFSGFSYNLGQGLGSTFTSQIIV